MYFFTNEWQIKRGRSKEERERERERQTFKQILVPSIISVVFVVAATDFIYFVFYIRSHGTHENLGNR